jgi:hypothetical protein
MQQIDSMSELKRLAIESSDLGKPFNYFFDLMDNNVIFNLKGHQVVEQIEMHDELCAVIAAVKNGAAQKMGKSIQVASPVFFEVPEKGFFHGSCFVLGLHAPLAVFYFSNVQTGLFAMDAIDQTYLFRFVLAKKIEMEKKH